MAEDLSKYPWKKKRSYVGLDTKRVNIEDTSELSPNYFAIQDLPKTLSAGKNSLLVQGTNNLLPNSEIKVEILDHQRNPVYWEITDWVDFAQRRAIVVYVYPETTPGPATITICGMTPAGHVRWTANVNIDPNVPNSTPILFSERPTILIEEVFKPMYKPTWTGDKIASQSVDDSHTRIGYQYSGKRGYENYSGSLSDNLDTSNNAKKLYTDNEENKTIWTTWNTDAITSPKGYKGFSNYSKDLPGFKNTTFKQDKSEISTQQGVTLTLSQSSTPAFEFTKEHEGGTLNIDSLSGISTTYTTKITKVVNKNTVLITDKLLDSSGNSVRSADNGTFSITHSASPDSYSGSQAYENFASFKLHDINPMTGDIYKVNVWARQHDSTNNEFELVASKILEPTNILIDKNVPPFNKPLGDFVTGSIVETYWSASSYTNTNPRAQYANQVPTGTNIASASWDNSNISEALKLSTLGDSPLTVGYAKLLPVSGGSDIFNIDVYNNCRYAINISALYASVSSSYSGSKFHVGVSGSSIDSTPINQDMKYLFNSTGFEGRILDTFSPDDLVRKSGTYSYNLDNLSIEFSPNQSGSVTPVIIAEGGEWSFSELSIESQEEIGYNPSYAEIEVPIAPKFDGSNLDFKFEYTDYLGNSSKDVTYINNVPFASGKQTFIQGDKNIVTGSLWVGEAISTGIEMKGVEGGAFIRTAGYGGFNAATGSGSPGFMVYSGSFSLTEDGVTTSYSGMGLELASGSSSSLRFSTDPSTPGLVIDANSLTITSITMSGGGTGSADITASWAINAISASYALSASHEIVYETSSSYADFAASGDGPFSGSFTGSFTGDGSGLSGIPGATSYWSQSSDGSITREGNVNVTGSLTISGSFHAFTLDSDNVVLGSGSGVSMEAGADNNVLIGTNAGASITTQNNNVLIGNSAGNALVDGNNIAIGKSAMFIATTAVQNVVIGDQVGYNLSTGDHNILIGAVTATTLQGGSDNILMGYDVEGSGGTGTGELRIGSSSVIPISASLVTGDVLFPSTASATYFVGDGSQLTNLPAGGATDLDGLTDAEIGGGAGSYYNVFLSNGATAGGATQHGTIGVGTTGNIAIGGDALKTLSTGDYNIGMGYNASPATTTGNHNIAIGKLALYVNNSSDNVAIGSDSGKAGSTYGQSVYIGSSAGAGDTVGQNTYIGFQAGNASTGGWQNIALGYQADVSAGAVHRTIAIGPQQTTTQSDTLSLGGLSKTLLHGEYGTTGQAKLGINLGTAWTIPTANLQVKGHASDATTFLVEDGSGDSILQVNQDGNVGIGTSDPNYNLHISQSGNVNVKVESVTGYSRLIIESSGSAATDSPMIQFNEDTNRRWQITADISDDGLKFTRSDMTAGSITPAFIIDSSDNSRFGGDIEATGSLLMSSSFTSGDTTSNTLKVMGSGSVSGSGLFEVIGDAGSLFSVADGLSGSLMAVTDESGIPVLEVFSDHTITAEGFRGWRPIQTQGSDFTLQLADSGYYHRVGGNVTCSLSASAGIPFPIGTEIEFIQTSSAGNVYITASIGSGITLNSKNDNLKLAGQWSAATIKKVALNEWDIIGDLT